MTKKILAGLGMAAMLLPFAASAATVTSNAIFNGQTQVWGNAGDTVQATFNIEVPAGQVLHAIRTKVDSQAPVCLPLGITEGSQNVDVTVDLKLPPNTNSGGYSLVADLYYTDTVPQAEAMTGNLACTSSISGSHVNTAAYNNGTVVNVLPVSSGSTSGSGNSGTSWKDQFCAAFPTFQGCVASTPAPVPTGNAAKCAAVAPFVNAQANAYTTAGLQLQSALLLDNPNSIALLAPGSHVTMGYFGPQTHQALYNYNANYGCGFSVSLY